MKTARSLLALLFITALVIGLCTTPISGVSAAPTNPGTTDLVGWWALDETNGTRYDAHTNALNLTDNNTVGYAAGIYGNAAHCIAANYESLSRASSSSLQMGTSDIYIAAWVQTATIGITHPIFSKWGAGATDKEYTLYLASDNVPYFAIASTTGTTSARWTGGALSLNTWYYVEGWTDKTNSKSYINVNNSASPISANLSSAMDAVSTTALKICRWDIGTNSLDGLIDEIVYYKRLLSADERTWLYNSTAGRTYLDVNPPTPTPTPTNTNTPSTCSLMATLTSAEWTNTGGINNDICTDNAIKMVWQEPSGGSGGSHVHAEFSTNSSVLYNVDFNGYYTSGHRVALECFNGSSWINMAVLQTTMIVDESITAALPQSCNDGSPLLRFYHSASGVSSHYLYIDKLILEAWASTPTSTLTPSITPSITLTPSITPSITLTPSITPSPSPTLTPSITPLGGIPNLAWDGTLTYGDFSTTVTTALLCMIVLLIGLGALIITTLQRRKVGK